MRKPPVSFLALFAATLLSACGGGGGGNLASYAAGFAALQGDTTLATPSLDSTVDARNAPATYNGFINIGTDPVGSPYGRHAYYGGISMTVNFSSATTDDAVTGTANDFVLYATFDRASPQTGSAVPGSLTLSGNLTGDNSFTDGIAATATGSIDGVSVAYDVDGTINGVGANGMSLGFDGTNAESSGGVALLVE